MRLQYKLRNIIFVHQWISELFSEHCLKLASRVIVQSMVPYTVYNKHSVGKLELGME